MREKWLKNFPWLNYYTPVNEPLTTARFSGLYGIWYPHGTDELSFITMLLNQMKGIVLAMRAIREINPDAQLIQTEDLAKTHSSPDWHIRPNLKIKEDGLRMICFVASLMKIIISGIILFLKVFP